MTGVASGAPLELSGRVLTAQALFEGERGNERDFLYRSLGPGARLVTMRLESAGKGLRGALDLVLGG